MPLEDVCEDLVISGVLLLGQRPDTRQYMLVPAVYRRDSSTRIETAAAYKHEADSRGGPDRTKVFVKQPCHAGTHTLGPRSAAPPCIAPSLNSFPSKLESCLTLSTNLDFLPHTLIPTHQSQWLLSRSVTLCLKASSSSTYLRPLQPLQAHRGARIEHQHAAIAKPKLLQA